MTTQQTETEKLYFKLDGEWFTEHLRNLCLEPNLTHAWRTMQESFHGMDINIIREAFVSIVKGEKKFIGINNLDLVETKDDDIFPLVKQHIFNAKSREELEEYEKYFKLSFYEKKEFFLTDKSEDMETEWAWITKAGFLLPVGFQGHNAKLDEIRDYEEVDEDYPIGENHWIKITTNDTIFCMNGEPTKEQLSTLKKYIESNLETYFRSSNVTVISGYGVAKYSERDNTVTIEGLDYVDVREPTYQASPKDRVKRISLSKAKELIENDCPVFIYKNSQYKRVPSVDFFYTKNSELYCEIKDLYSTIKGRN